MGFQTIERHREWHREYMRAWRKSHPRTPEQKLRHNAENRKWESMNKEKVSARRKEIYDARPQGKRNLYQQRYTAELRKMLSDIKMASGCVDCGFKKHPAALHFDHLPQYEKRFGISNIAAGKQALLDEVNKCEVRCANCHSIKTVERREEKKRKAMEQ